ncbi:unnamed protein product [Moneuplotes crassus]|uniref:Uncharacterized protein n=1 Tax=Euplotes crassus TaxID=5936 RepID=A0AAD1Y7C3_EUPCR|nr:unnamed protein product [Moneuplotes crassus]
MKILLKPRKIFLRTSTKNYDNIGNKDTLFVYQLFYKDCAYSSRLLKRT